MLRIEEVSMRKSMLAVASHANAVPTGEALSEAHAISALAALAQPTRLAIFRLLVKHEPVGVTAGVIAETIGAPHNTLSSHLAILVRAGPAAQFPRGSHDHLSFGRRRDRIGNRISRQRLLRRASGALQSGRGRRRGLLRAGVGEDAVAQREKGGRQAQELIVGTGHDLDDLGNGRSDRRRISERTRGGERRP